LTILSQVSLLRRVILKPLCRPFDGSRPRYTRKPRTDRELPAQLDPRFPIAGDRLYVTELSPGVKGKKTRLFEVTGHELRFKAHSTVPEKLVQAFASAVKSAP
jgi:hypothetical protein